MLPRKGNNFKHKMGISISVRVPENIDMHTQDFRRRNLATALQASGTTRAELSRMADCPPSHITMLLNGPRPFGHDLARKFEALLNLRSGWLDEEIPLTDKAIGIARKFQTLNEDHQREVGELVVAFKAIEDHQDEVRRLKPNNGDLAG